MSTKAKPVSRSFRAGLHMPVGRISARISDVHKGAVSSTASVAMAAVIEVIAAEVVEAAVVRAKDQKKKRVTPRFIADGVFADEDLHQLLCRYLVAGGGTRAPDNKVFADRKAAKKAKARKAAEKKALKEALDDQATSSDDDDDE